MKKTIVINLFGGSCNGKSTTACGVFYDMKTRGLSVELALEYIKKWAWRGQFPKGFDQPYIFGKQLHAESQLYGKVDYIVTDAPVMLSPFYESFYTGREIVLPSALKFLQYAEQDGIIHLNFWLKRQPGTFSTEGRFQNEDQALEIDVAMRAWMDKNGIKLIDVDCPRDQRVQVIVNHVLEVAREASTEGRQPLQSS